MDHDSERDNDPIDQFSPRTDRDEDFGLKSPKNRTPWNTISARVISLVSRKGGVGKTTSAINLGAALSLSGHSVLIVGVDPQCGVASSLGYSPENLQTSLTEIFTIGASLSHLVQSSPLENLSFTSPNVTSLTEEEEFSLHMDQHIDTFVNEIDHARNLYDTIIIDCPPSLGAITRAALLASDTFLVPVQAEELCRDSLAPLLDFIKTYRKAVYSEIERQDAQPLSLEGLFLTMVNKRTRMSKHVSAKVDQDYAGSLFKTSIPRTTRLTEMALLGKPAVIYDRRSAGSRAYFDLADEIVERFRQARDTENPDSSCEAPTDEDIAWSNLDETMSASTNPLSVRPTLPSEPVSGLDRFLQELRTTVKPPESSILNPTEPQAPEMVSLDELLAEEEKRAADETGWEETGWRADNELGDRLN